MGRYKTRELAHVWIDYIKALLVTNENNKNINFLKLKWLSKNSNFFWFDFYWFELIIQKLPVDWGKWHWLYQVLYKNTSICFIGIDWIAQKNIIPLDMVEMTGQGLAIFWIDFFYFIMDYFWFEFLRYKRIDMALDIFINTNYFYKNVLMKKYKDEKTHTPIIKKWECETIYFWERDIKKNNYQLIRIYNKIIDSVKKEKLFLYFDERKNEKWEIKDVTRFEVEIREDLAKKWDYYEINNINSIFAKLNKTFFHYNKQFFKFIDFSDFHNYFEDLEKSKKEKKKILKEIKAGNTDIKPKTKYQEKILKQVKNQETFAKYGKYFLSEKEKQQSTTMFLAYAKKLYLNGFTKQKLKEIIDNIEDLEN